MSDALWSLASLPHNECDRLTELADYQILDTKPEATFDRLTRMAARRFGMPIALVSLVDKNRQWFKSHYGIDAAQTPRDMAFCAHVILQDDVMVVHDTVEDPRFAANPLVTGKPDIRFYAGAPLTTSKGYKLGTVCVIDRVPHPEFTDEDKVELAEFAAIAVDEMELRLAVKKMRQDLEALEEVQHALEAAREKAEQATLEKSIFLANISHELRTPLNGILGMAYLIGDTQLDKTQREYIDTINHSAQNLLLLINDVLDISKIEAKELILEKSLFDIKNSFLQTVNLLKPLAINKGIVLSSNIASDMPSSVVGDRGRFAQIVTNLVGNAVKFTEKGGVEAFLHFDNDKHVIYCEVKDTGIGIPESRREAIFEKFIQGDASITQKYGGTGLGLAITKQLVVMLGGEICFESRENEGSRFWFTLPAGLADSIPDSNVKTVTRDLEMQRINVRDARVLIAEDHAVNQLFLMALLKKFGFAAIDVAENGIEVMEKLESSAALNQGRRYDAIFMDCKMPERDGYETARLIRQCEANEKKYEHIPIVAMTANALSGDREACFDAGMDAYLSKPLQPELLMDVLKRWFIFSTKVDALPVSASKSHNAPPPLDFRRLHMAAETEADKASLLRLFFRLADEFMVSMENARRNNEFEQWKHIAHSLKGSSANLGMVALADLCIKSENAESLTYGQRTELLSLIKEEIQRIRVYVIQHNPTFGAEV